MNDVQLDAKEVVQQTVNTATEIIANLIAEVGLLKAQIAALQKPQPDAAQT